MKKLRIRGPTRAHLDVIEAWGAVPTAMGAGEVYDAVSRGALDGVCTGWSSHYKRAFYEVCKYFYGPMSESIWILAMNLDRWNGLTKDDQKILVDASKEFKEFTRVNSVDDDNKCIAQMRKAGANDSK